MMLVEMLKKRNKAISVIRNRSVDEESESDSRGGFLQIAQGKGRESVTFNIATLKQTDMRNIPTHSKPKDPILSPIHIKDFKVSLFFMNCH